MKKITFLLFLLTVSLGYSQTLPFDFSNTNQAFENVSSTSTSIITEPGSSPANKVLQIVGAASNWANVEIYFATRVDLSDPATNSISFRMKATVDYGVRAHLFKFIDPQMGSEIEGFFETAPGTDWQVISIDFDFTGTTNSSSNPGNYGRLVIFTDAGSTNTGTYLIDDISAPEAAAETCSDGIQNQNETGIDCGGTICAACDLTAPTGFTAVLGNVTAFSVELLLTATDASGNITYDVSYNAGTNTAQTTGVTAVQKSLIIGGLSPEILYSFNVSASDASGNEASNNAIILPATTTADTSNPCAGQSIEAGVSSQPWSNGYTYTIETLPNGTEVKFTIELLETGLTGINAELQRKNPIDHFPMTNVSGQIYEYTVSGLKTNDVISYAGRFAYSTGLLLTKFFEYTVGDDCSTLGLNDFDLASFKAYPNPTKNSWTVKTKNKRISNIQVFDILGKNVLLLSPNANEAKIEASGLSKGLYFARIQTNSGSKTIKLVKR